MQDKEDKKMTQVESAQSEHSNQVNHPSKQCVYNMHVNKSQLPETTVEEKSVEDVVSSYTAEQGGDDLGSDQKAEKPDSDIKKLSLKLSGSDPYFQRQVEAAIAEARKLESKENDYVDHHDQPFDTPSRGEIEHHMQLASCIESSLNRQ